MPEISTLPEHLVTISDTEANESPRTQVYQINHIQQIGSGMEGIVYRVSIADSAGQTETLVLKRLSEPVHAPELKDTYDLAKKAGLPVPDTFVVANEGLLMSDLSDNGQNLVLSLNDLKRSNLDRLQQTQPQLMATFSRLDLNNLDTSIRQIDQLAKAANLTIDNSDAWFFVMKPSGEMRLVLTDFLHVTQRLPTSSVDTLSSLKGLQVLLKDAQGVEEDEAPFWQR